MPAAVSRPPSTEQRHGTGGGGPAVVGDDWEVERLAGALGAEVRGLELRQATPAMVERIKALLVEHLVLFFPQQELNPEEHFALAQLFGPVEGNATLAKHDAIKEITELKASAGGVADMWHTDVTFRQEPPMMGILRMVKAPPIGGDTMWTNLCAAYEALSPPMKELCDGLTAMADEAAHGKPEQSAVHPVVRVHPVSGKKALFVNEEQTRRIVEMGPRESKMLLEYLTTFVQDPRFTIRYHWEEGTVAMWDNRQTQHIVITDFDEDEERVIQRVTVSGDEPQGVFPKESPRWEPFTAKRKSQMAWLDVQLKRHLKKNKTPTTGGTNPPRSNPTSARL